jgi:hypothetical protein
MSRSTTINIQLPKETSEHASLSPEEETDVSSASQPEENSDVEEEERPTSPASEVESIDPRAFTSSSMKTPRAVSTMKSPRAVSTIKTPRAISSINEQDYNATCPETGELLMEDSHEDSDFELSDGERSEGELSYSSSVASTKIDEESTTPKTAFVEEPESGDASPTNSVKSTVRTFARASKEDDLKLLDTINSILDSDCSDVEFSDDDEPVVVDLKELEKRLVAADERDENLTIAAALKTRNEEVSAHFLTIRNCHQLRS